MRFAYKTFKDWWHAQGCFIRNNEPEKICQRVWDYKQEDVDKLKSKLTIATDAIIMMRDADTWQNVREMNNMMDEALWQIRGE